MRAFLLVCVILTLTGCGDSVAPPPEERTDRRGRARGQLVRAAASFGINAWSAAEAELLALRAAEPDEPVAAFNLAVCAFRRGRLDSAWVWLEQAPLEGPARAFRALLEAALHYEEGADDARIAALVAACEAAPGEPAYAWEAGRVLAEEADPRASALLTRAWEQWPENGAIAVSFLLHAACVPALRPAAREAGEALSARLGDATLGAEVRALLAGDAAPAAAPPALHMLANLLRGTDLFRADAAALQARLEPTLLLEPQLPDLRRRVGLRAVSLAEEAPPASVPAGVREVVPVAGAAPFSLGLLSLDGKALHWADAPLAKAVAVRPLNGQSLVAADVDGAPGQEAFALADDAVMLLGGAPGWEERGRLAGSFTGMLVLDVEADQDLDLLLTDGSDSLGLWLNRGSAGFARGPALARVAGRRWRCAEALDLDGDLDRELVLGGATGLDVLVNLRQGSFAPRAFLPVAAPVRRLVAGDYSGDGASDLLVLTEAGLVGFRAGAEGLAYDPVASACLAEAGVVTEVALVDLDRDGDLDLVCSGPAAFENLGDGRWRGCVGLLPADTPDGGILAEDLDGDHDEDLLLWDASRARRLTAQGRPGADWVGVRLSAPPAKAPADARGVLVEVFAADRRIVRRMERPWIDIACGDAPEMLTATWPNGIREYLFRPPPGTRDSLHMVMRLEGSCPFLYARDGEDWRFVTDLLGVSPLGLLVAPGVYASADPDELLPLPAWTATTDGFVELLITEELRELSYFDEVRLYAADVPPGHSAYSLEKWVFPPIEGRRWLELGPLRTPRSVRDDRGRERREEVLAEDGVHLRGFEQRGRFPGSVAPHSLVLTAPEGIAGDSAGVLVMLGWLHWSNTSINVRRAQDGSEPMLFPRLEVPDGAGGWRIVSTNIGLPAGKTKPIVVPLGALLDPADPRLRITTSFEVAWDLLAFATSSPPSRPLVPLPLAEATLRFGGFARPFSEEGGPLQFDRGDLRPYPWRLDERGRERPLVWQEMSGFRSAFGDAAAELLEVDDRLVIFGDGEELVLRFDARSLPALAEGWTRRYFLYSTGWCKDGDFNVAHGQSVEPLPFGAMSGYPYAEPYPDDPALAAWRAAKLTRWVGRERLERRIPGP